MRLIRPSRDPLPRKHDRRERVSRVPKRIPDWLRDHIADKGEYVLFDCGHKTNINSRSVTIITSTLGRNTQVFCEPCGQFVSTVRHMRFREYVGLPPVEDSDIPLF